MWNISELLNKLNIDPTRLHDLLVYNPHAPMIFKRHFPVAVCSLYPVLPAFAAPHHRPPDVRHPVFLLFLL